MMILSMIFMFIMFIMYLLNFILMKKKIKIYEKMLSFECGFDLFSIQRMPFSLQFYLISIIFLIFDIEISLLMPMLYSINMILLYKWILIFNFMIIILLLGLYLEWNEGILYWFK
uniref:NADH-ubiquinone oxidoreductase chain 3 n=1 Tax=Trichopria drosophilae TaxID=1507179 RepID=A0A6M3HU20_9HYME|nr:NADH dehydrogenase subunit 3 [Trichopria drosophilae]QIV21183.1 NADH dehydrogenase subunit 3 [Trichopria drosophilae]